MKQEAKCGLEEPNRTAAGWIEPHQTLGGDEAGQICQVVAAVPPHSKAPCTATESGMVSVTQYRPGQQDSALWTATGVGRQASHSRLQHDLRKPKQVHKLVDPVSWLRCAVQSAALATARHLGQTLWYAEASLPVLPACSLLPESPIREMLWKSASLKTELLWTHRAGPWKGASFS